MKDVVIWLLIFWGVFGIFNWLIRWPAEKYKSKKFIARAIYFLMATSAVFYYYQSILLTYAYWLMLSVLITSTVSSLILTKKLYAKISKDRYFLLFQIFNIAFQQIMIVVGIYILRSVFPTSYKDYYFGVLFFILHLPVIVLPWAKLRFPIISYALFGGILSSYLITNYSFGLLASFFAHFVAYIFAIYYVKDEKKI